MEFNLQHLKTITVLYVEDDKEVRDKTSKLFEKLFKKVYIVLNGQEGVDIFNQYFDEIEIIISDINMPVKNGLEMMQEINREDIPIILTTAYLDQKFLLASIDFNVNKYINKPFKVKELIFSISDLVEQYREKVLLKKNAQALAFKSKEIFEEYKILKAKSTIMYSELALLNHLSDNFICIIKTNKKGNIIDVSTKFCSLFLYTKDEILQTNINKLDGNNEKATLQKYMLDIIHTKKAIAAIHNFIDKKHNNIKCNIHITAHLGQDGYINGYNFYLDKV